MIALQRLTFAELKKRLAPYKCRKIADLSPGIEMWLTGWGEPFTLTPEDGMYDDFDYRRVVFLIGKTMPPSWQMNNNDKNGKT